MRTRTTIATLTLIAALAAPPVAGASGADVIADCINNAGQLSKTYRQSEYRDALAKLPADADQYSDCRDVIRDAARAAGLSGGKSTTPITGSGSSWSSNGGIPGVPPGVDPLTTVTPAEKQAIQQATSRGDEPVVIDGRPVDPGELGAATVSSVLDLPDSLLAVLAVLALVTLACIGTFVRSHVRKRPSA